MSKKIKGVSLDSTPSYAGGVYEDAKARSKHQNLLQDYQELQKEIHGMRNKLQTAKQRKQILAAEVRFLRKRHRYLLETKFLNSPQEQKLVASALPYAVDHSTKSKKDQVFSRKGAILKKIPQVSDSKPKRKHIGKEAATRTAIRVTNVERKKKSRGKTEDSQRALTPKSDMNRGRINNRKEPVMRKTPLVFDLNEKERMCDASVTGPSSSISAFDLNHYSTGKEARLPSRAPIFDLNEVSTGDEDFQSNYEPLKLEDARKGSVKGLNDEQHNDLKLSVCRNAGEGSTRVRKRKISWQDPVALRV